jgi:hypothetical protein
MAGAICWRRIVNKMERMVAYLMSFFSKSKLSTILVLFNFFRYDYRSVSAPIGAANDV